MNAFKTGSRALLVVTLCAVFVQTLSAAPFGGFAVVLDKSDSNGDSRRSLVFYDTDNMTRPLFGVFLGTEAQTSASGSFFEDPDSLTVNPETGDVYVLAFDSGSPADPITTEPDGDLDGRGDYDLLRVNFRAAYQHWEANFFNTYVTYGDGTSAFDASHTNPQFAPAVVDKIGEIGRSPGSGIAFSFTSQLEFVNPTTLAYTDSQTGSTGGATDVQVRTIFRVSATPGLAVPLAGGTQGGFNNGTSESWQSAIEGDGVTTGFVNLDGQFTSDVVSTAVVRNRNGITGMWILENDGTGDQLAFYDFATNSYRSINIFSSSIQRLVIDNNAPGNDDLGTSPQMLVDPLTGDLVIVEDGFSDNPQHQPAVYKYLISSYDVGGEIKVSGVTGRQVLDPTAYDDGTDLIDGRNAIFDWVNNAVFFFDEDGQADTLNGGIAFGHDWYRLDLNTGMTTAVGPNADLSNGLFDILGNGADDQVEFFYIPVPEPTSLVLCVAILLATGGLRRR